MVHPTRHLIATVLLLTTASLGWAGCVSDMEGGGSSDGGFFADGGDAGGLDTGATTDTGTTADTGVTTDTGWTTDTGGAYDTDLPQDTGGTTDTGSADTGPADTGTPDTGPADTGSAASCTGGDSQCPAGCDVTNDRDCTLDCRDASTWPREWVVIEDEVLRLVNIERQSTANCGGTTYGPSPPLTMNPRLREAARCHTVDMVTNNFMSHTGSNNSSMRERIDATGYSWSYIAENVAAGYTSAAEVVAGWMGSSGHCKNIMNDRSEHIGVGFVYDLADSARYDHYWTQNFGAPR